MQGISVCAKVATMGPAVDRSGFRRERENMYSKLKLQAVGWCVTSSTNTSKWVTVYLGFINESL